MKIKRSKLLVAMFASPLMLPHLLLYRFHPNRELIKSDLRVGGRNPDLQALV